MIGLGAIYLVIVFLLCAGGIAGLYGERLDTFLLGLALGLLVATYTTLLTDDE